MVISQREQNRPRKCTPNYRTSNTVSLSLSLSETNAFLLGSCTQFVCANIIVIVTIWSVRCRDDSYANNSSRVTVPGLFGCCTELRESHNSLRKTVVNGTLSIHTISIFFLPLLLNRLIYLTLSADDWFIILAPSISYIELRLVWWVRTWGA